MATATDSKMISEEHELLKYFGATAEELPDILELLRKAKPEANIVVAGRAGTGKSTLINALCGAGPQDAEAHRPAKERHELRQEDIQNTETYEASATYVSIGSELQNFSIKVWDSPGLGDGTGKDRVYLMQVNVKCKDGIDILLYCIDMSKTRAIVGEMVPGLQLVTEVFGEKVWEHAIIVFTRANNVKPKRASKTEGEKSEDFSKTMDHWQSKVREALDRAGINGFKIPIEPAGHYIRPHLPDRTYWLGHLWLFVLKSVKPTAQITILLNAHDYLNSAETLSPLEQESPSLDDRPKITIDEKAHNSILKRLPALIKKLVELILNRKKKGSQ